MTSPHVLSDEVTRSVLDILTSPSDQHNAHLDAAQLPAVLPAGPPPLAADVANGAFSLAADSPNNSSASSPSSGYSSSMPGSGYTPFQPGSGYVTSAYGGSYQPLLSPGDPGARPPAAPGAPVPGTGVPYKFPAKQPKPGEFRILKDIGAEYNKQNAAALADLAKREKDKSKSSPEVVRYLNDKQREKYRVNIGTVITRGGAPFDTKRAKAKYVADGSAGMYLFDEGTKEQHLEWGFNGMIWVCVGDAKGTEKPSFFSHVGRKDRFHHSSFNRGGGVIGAGEWIIKEGALIKVSATSGHYQPSIDYLYHAVLQMAVAFRDQATTGATTVFLYDKQTATWVDYPVKEFIKSPTGGGRYAAHPTG